MHVAIIFHNRVSLALIKQWFGDDVHAEMLVAGWRRNREYVLGAKNEGDPMTNHALVDIQPPARPRRKFT